MINIEFAYPGGDKKVLNGINLSIKRGARIGFIGGTGCGKTTLINLIMGLLLPTSGAFRVDGLNVEGENIPSWQARIAHVPQDIFIADMTVAENIAFGVDSENIDYSRVGVSAEKAKISEDIQSWPKLYGTRLGERGVRLSGGQRQRIGIARALYKEADIIILDEATSSLDSKKESEVMEIIDSISRDVTILIVAHRVSTLSKCDQIVELRGGKIERMCSYDELQIN